ncbi:hypothetical protein ACF0H5_016199 [Mactra antiquata]
MMEMESRISLQSLPDSEVFSPSSIEHQDVFMYEDDKRGSSFVTDGSPTILDISNSMKASFQTIKTEPETDPLISWTQKHPEHWSQNEILDWIYFVAGSIDVDPTTIRGEGFQNITGPELCRMTEEDFLKRDPVNGKCFHDMFRSMHKHALFIEPELDFNHNLNQSEMKQENKLSHCHYSTPSNRVSEESLLTSHTGSDMEVLIDSNWYDIDPCVEIPDEIEKIACQMYPTQTSFGYNCSDSESLSDASESIDIYHKMQRNDSTGSDVLSDDDYSQLTIGTTENDQRPTKKKTQSKRKPSDQQKPQNRGRKPGQISKGNHLWEFIRDLLKDPKYNPHLLRWEEKETGVFRFVQSEAVAQMWGRKKNNPGMTYEKLSRAMRFCRTAGTKSMDALDIIINEVS